ncbi:MAG: hypothetical protein RIR48_2517 [Bacteroidota bacterium]
MSLDDAKRALKACEDGIDTAKAIYKSNQALIDKHNNVDVPARKTEQQTWDKAKADFEAKYSRWDQKKDEYEKWSGIVGSIDTTFNKSLGWYNDCRDKSNTSDTNWQCGWEAENVHKLYDPWGFYAYESFRTGGIGPCHWFDVRCKRKDSSKQKINTDYNKEKPQFTGGEKPKDLQPPEQNKTQISISCCANILNVIGSEIKDSDIKQQNECLSSSKNAIAKEEQRLKDEEERKRKEEEQRKIDEENRRRQEEEQRRINEENRLKKLEEELLKRLEEQRKQDEQRKQEEEQRKMEEQKRLEEQRKMEEQKKIDEEKRKQEEQKRREESEGTNLFGGEPNEYGDYGYDVYEENTSNDLLNILLNKPYLKEALLIIVIIIILVLYFR